MGLSQTGFVSMMFIFLIVLPSCVVEGRTRLLYNLDEESVVGTRGMSSGDQAFSGHRDAEPSYNSVRKLVARRREVEATEAPSVPALSSSRRRVPFHPSFVSKFPFFAFAKNSDTVSPSPGTPSPGHN